MSTYHWPADEIRYLAPVAGKGSTKIPVSRAWASPPAGANAVYATQRPSGENTALGGKGDCIRPKGSKVRAAIHDKR